MRFKTTQTEGMLASDPKSQEAGSLWAEGWVSLDRGQATIAVTIRNRGTDALPLSYVGDQYFATTSTGRSVALEKGDFFHYPDLLTSGEEHTITLHVPRATPVDTITAIDAKLNNGRVTLTLNAMHSPAAPPPTGNVTPVPAIEPVPAPPARQSLELGRAASAIAGPGPAPAAPTPPALVMPQSTVPVTMTFLQEFGSALQLRVAWDDSSQHVTLQPHDRRTFLVAPGPHVCHLRTGLGLSNDTMADIPLLVREDTSDRVLVRASVQLTGVQLIVRVWQGSALVLQNTFAPGAHEPIRP